MMLPCNIVKDLLPSYLEKLTSPETDAEIEAHLEGCEGCRAAKAAMEADIFLIKTPKPKFDFIKKLRAKQLIGAVLSILITMFCLLWLYGQEFNIDATNTAGLEAAIDERSSHYEIEANVLESKKLGNQILVLYEDVSGGADAGFRRCGIMQLQSGIFGKYRASSCFLSDWPLYLQRNIELSGQYYKVVCGVNELPGVATWGVYTHNPDAAYYYYDENGNEIENEAARAAGEAIVSGKSEYPLLEIFPVTEQQANDSPFMADVHYFDANGDEIDGGELLEHFDVNGGGGGGFGGGNLSRMLCFMGIVLILGVVFVRYFLKP